MLPVITPNFRFPAVTLSLNPPKMSLQLKTSNAVQISDSSKGMAGKVRLETHQDDPMLNVLQISDCQKSISLNSSTLCVPALQKSQMRLSLPDFSHQARFLNPTGLGRKLKCCPDFRFRQRKWPASYVLKPTNMIQCRMYVAPDSQPAMSLNPPSPRSPWK